MNEKGLRSPFVRRIITFILFAGISAALMGLYYLVYLPEQHEQYNERTFRILREITNNFKDRVGTFETKFKYGLISDSEAVQPIARIDISSIAEDSTTFNQDFKNSFNGDAEKANKFQSIQRIENDSIFYQITNNKDTLKRAKAISEILDPLIAIHANTFQSVLLIKQKSDTLKKKETVLKSFDSIVYKSPSSYIVNINTDSLLANKGMVVSALSDVTIEGVGYKIFFVPFEFKTVANGTFIIAGLISQQNYRQQSQALPLSTIFEVSFLLILLLLALPFLKIFVLSVQENITIKDIRILISAIFIIPFVITLFVSALWLYKYPEDFSTHVLDELQASVKTNFYNEIKQCIKQAKDYDTLINDISTHPFLSDSEKKASLYTIKGVNTLDLKDFFFYPRHYRNIDNVHWMDSSGDDIASWTFIKQPPTYFKLADRQYFKEILYNRGFRLSDTTEPFYIQPTISRLTGEFTVNISLAGNMALSDKKKARVVGISAKMYSIYKTVVPAGFSYCIINDAGDILVHSDTARSLQENLFQETSDNHQLHIALDHKDAMVLDIDLYEHPVKMMVRPMPGLPYYLVTYYDKKGEYLFIAHILGFVFLCQSVILLFVTIFSYCMMMVNRKIYKLNFSPGVLEWLKPSPSKKEYYMKNCFLLFTIAMVVLIFSVFVSEKNYYLYMLNASLLLPLFAITGYYLIKGVKEVIEKNVKEEDVHKSIVRIERKDQPLWLSGKQFFEYLSAIKSTLFLYVLSVVIFSILKYKLFYKADCSDNNQVIYCIRSLLLIIPIIMLSIAGANFEWLSQSVSGHLKRRTKKLEERIKNSPVFAKYFNLTQARHDTSPDTGYLTLFIVSLLLSVAVICVIPTITFTGYALRQEKKLHFQTYQIELARRIQQRRAEWNSKFWQTKVLEPLSDSAKGIDSLKFSVEKGLYLVDNTLDTIRYPRKPLPDISCSPFYRLITQFLFLPPEHDEFFDNVSHKDFYFWKETADAQKRNFISLYYKNLTDYKNKASIRLKAELPHFDLFQRISSEPTHYLIILVLLIFIFLFYKLIYSTAKRIFLVGFFDKAIKPVSDDWLKLKNYPKIVDLCKSVFPLHTPSTIAMLREREKKEKDIDGGEVIMQSHLALTPLYERIWKDCSDTEKFILYDFALDGFTNYKKVGELYKLYEKGLLVKDDNNFTLMTKSFRNFLITKESSSEVKTLSKQVKGSWAAMRTVFYIILIAVAIFIFISQEEASKRLITVVSSFAALLPVILKLFDKSTFNTSNNKAGS